MSDHMDWRRLLTARACAAAGAALGWFGSRPGANGLSRAAALAEEETPEQRLKKLKLELPTTAMPAPRSTPPDCAATGGRRPMPGPGSARPTSGRWSSSSPASPNRCSRVSACSTGWVRHAAAAVARRRLRAAGVTQVPRGPQAATRANPAGLTGRQLEILGLVADGLTNAEIAARLVLSVRTVDHHVSAVLTKLGVTSRRDAIAAARSGR